MENNEKVFKVIADSLSGDKRFALVTLTEASQGSPRKSGAKMIVYPGPETVFSIGGGALEKEAVDKALEALGEEKNISYSTRLDGEGDGMICGGECRIFIETFTPPERVVIFGGGHIGFALSRILDAVKISYTVVDDRPDFAVEERFPNAARVLCLPWKEAPSALFIDDKSYCVIVTHGHRGDQVLLSSLASGPAPYIGMIGSSSKVKTLFKNIEGRGVKLPYSRIFSPVGLDLGGDSPGEIALAIAAEIVKVKYKASGESMRKIKK